MTKGLLKKSDLENVEERDKETVEEIDRELISKQMQTETSALLSTLDLFKRYSVFYEKMAKTDDTSTFWNLFTDNVMLPYVMLWYGMRFAN